MRRQQERTGPLFSYISKEQRIPASHPLRQVRRLADQALDRLNPTFRKLYPEGGRPSIPPEQLLLALLLQAIYGIRTERMLIEQLDYNLLFRWCVWFNSDDHVWHPTSFTKNRDRLLNEELMAKFLELLLTSPEWKPLVSSEHFSVYGTLLGPGPLTAHWSGSMALTTVSYHRVMARVLSLLPTLARRVPRATCTASCQARAKTGPGATRKLGHPDLEKSGLSSTPLPDGWAGRTAGG